METDELHVSLQKFLIDEYSKTISEPFSNAYTQCHVCLSSDIDGQSNERIYPSNTAVIAGKQFYLVCENYSDRITTTWKFLRVGTYADRVIYNGIHILDEFRSFQVHSTSDGLSNLTKPIASVDDAGTYKCIQSNGSDFVVSSAQVIVF